MFDSVALNIHIFKRYEWFTRFRSLAGNFIQSRYLSPIIISVKQNGRI